MVWSEKATPPDSSLHRPVRRLWPAERVTRNEIRFGTGFNVGANGTEHFCTEVTLSLPTAPFPPRTTPWPTGLVRRCGAPLSLEGSPARSHEQSTSWQAKAGSSEWRTAASGDGGRLGLKRSFKLNHRSIATLCKQNSA